MLQCLSILISFEWMHLEIWIISGRYFFFFFPSQSSFICPCGSFWEGYFEYLMDRSSNKYAFCSFVRVLLLDFPVPIKFVILYLFEYCTELSPNLWAPFGAFYIKVFCFSLMAFRSLQMAFHGFASCLWTQCDAI